VGTGFSTVIASNFLYQIDGVPENYDWNSNGHISWATYNGAVDAAGNVVWSANLGIPSMVDVGQVAGFMLIDDSAYTPDFMTLLKFPSLKQVPVAASPSPSSTSTSSGSPESPSRSGSADNGGGAGPATTPQPASTTPQAAADTTKAAKAAASYLVNHLPKKSDGFSASLDAALALLAVSETKYTKQITKLAANLEDLAAEYLKNNPAGAAKYLLLKTAMGKNGDDLIKIISKGTAKDGTVGSYPSAFSQALVILGLRAAGEPIPAKVVKRLVAFQDASGAFGYESGGFAADPDSTALAILALDDPALSKYKNSMQKALAWAKAAQKQDGSWQAWSPVDTVGLLGSALEKVTGKQQTAARKYLLAVQLESGAFSNGAGANLMSTENALYLLAGKAYGDYGKLGKVPTKSSSTPTSSSKTTASAAPVTDHELPITGMDGSQMALAALAVLFLATGAGIIVRTRKVH
jgi:hypothetical protein